MAIHIRYEPKKKLVEATLTIRGLHKFAPARRPPRKPAQKYKPVSLWKVSRRLGITLGRAKRLLEALGWSVEKPKNRQYRRISEREAELLILFVRSEQGRLLLDSCQKELAGLAGGQTRATPSARAQLRSVLRDRRTSQEGASHDPYIEQRQPFGRR